MTAKNPEPYFMFSRLLHEIDQTFGMEATARVLVYHYYTGSGSGNDGQHLNSCTYLDFPEPYNVEGPGGIVEKIVAEFPTLFSDYELSPEESTSDPVASFLLESRAGVSQTLAFPQTESAAQ